MTNRFLLAALAILAACACIGCGEPAAAGQQPVVETPAALLEIARTPTPEPIKAPTAEPTEAPTPEPAGAYGTVKADGAGVLCTMLGRGETLRLTGERGEYYIALLDGQTVWVEKRLVRADGEEPFAAWDGYARKNAAVYAAPYPEGEPAAVLQQNTRVRVVDALGDLLLIEWDDGRQGCVREAQISKKRISGGGSGGADGGDIVLGWRAPAPRGAARLDAKKMDAAFAPCGGTVRCSGTEAYRLLFGRGDRVVVTGGEGTLCIVLADGAEGSLPARLVRMDDAPAYEPWTGYAVSKARLFGDWRLCGPATTLDKNTEVRVLDDLGGCYLAEAGGTTGYLASDEVQTERIRSSGGSGGEWTEPVL